MNSISEQKSTLRRQLLAVRRQVPAEQRAAFNKKILSKLRENPELRAAQTQFCFLSQPDEFDTRPFIDECLAAGKRIVVPKIISGRPMIAVAFDGWNRLMPGQLGIAVPESNVEYAGDVDAVITPGVGFTPEGDRLGFGRGYYDQWFAAHPVALRIAPCYECQIVERLPMDARDVRVTHLVTEDRVVRLV